MAEPIQARFAPSEPHVTVLIVSASPRLRSRLAPRLADRFERVLTAASAEDALYALMQHAVDVVLASTDLPGLDGLALNAALRERGGPPLVLAHRFAESHHRSHWIDAGVADCVVDSEPAEQIAARCSGVMRRSTMARGTKEGPWTTS